jgi:hypothetical protein
VGVDLFRNCATVIPCELLDQGLHLALSDVQGQVRHASMSRMRQQRFAIQKVKPASAVAPNSSPRDAGSTAWPDQLPTLAASARTPAPMSRRHRRPILAVRSEDAVVPGQVHARRWHQRREPRHQVQRLRHDVRGAVPVWSDL